MAQERLGVRRLVAAFRLANLLASQDVPSLCGADWIVAQPTATSRLKKAGTSPRTPNPTRASSRSFATVLLLLSWAGLWSCSGAVLLNEVMSRNDSVLADEDGAYPDWVELHNSSAAGINLAGYGLSDDPAQAFKWVFPLKVIPANGYLVVFTSNKDRTNGANLHANFAISAEGETLRLTRPDGLLADELRVGLLPSNFSLGRPPGMNGGLLLYGQPSPAAPNNTVGYPERLPAPAYSHASGSYGTGFSLSVTSTVAGGVVRYTLDGSEPTTNSPVYTRPLDIRDRSLESNGISMISGTATVNQHTDGWLPPNGLVYKGTVVRARVFRAEAWPSAVATATYFVGSGAAQRYSLPVVSIATAPFGLFDYTNGIYMLGLVFDQYRAVHPAEPLTGHTPANYTQRGKAWERAAHLEWLAPGGGGGFAQDVKIDIQGQSSRSFRQKSLGVKARSDTTPIDAIGYPVFPGLTNRAGALIPRLKGLRLRNSGNDWAYTLFRDELCHRIAAGTDVDTLSYRPVVTFLNGEYWGILNVREQEDEDYLADHYEVPPEQVTICETSGSVIYGQPGDNRHFLNLRAYVETNDLSDPAKYAYVRTQMDVENFLCYQAAEIYFANADWPHNNIRFWRLKTPQYRPEAPLGHDGRWRWLLFDLDLSVSHPWSGGYGDNTLSAALSPTGRPGLNAPWSTALLRGLTRNRACRDEFINTLADGLNSAFKENHVTNVITEIESALSPMMNEHIRRWRTMGNSFNTWSNNVRGLRTFASQRPINVRQHVVAQFGLAGFANLTLNVSPAGRGHVRVNRLLIHETTPGVTNGLPYPWRGVYFRGLPIQLRAEAAPGYAFSGWSERPDLTTQDTFALALTSNTTLTAVFQRSPPPHDLNIGPYRLTAWNEGAPAGTYPSHMRFQQTAQPDPPLTSPLESDWRWAYNLTNRSRMVGLRNGGLAFLNTSDPQELPGAGYLGAAVLALRTIGVSNVQVSWLAGTVLPNQRIYGLRLQYALGEGPFLDVFDRSGQPVEYIRNPVSGHEQLLGPVLLPPETAHQAYLQLRWKYHFLSGTSGPRAQLRLDDILVTSSEPPLPGTLFQPSLSGDGSAALGFVGSAHLTYTLETSTDLVTWNFLDRATTDIDGRAQIILPGWRVDRERFYRLHLP